MGYYYFYFKYKFYAWNKLYSPFGSSTFHTSLIPVADYSSKMLSPFSIFSLLGKPANCGGVYRGNTTVSRL